MQKIVILKRRFPSVIYETVKGNVDEQVAKEVLTRHNKNIKDVYAIIQDGTQIVIGYWQYEYTSIFADDAVIQDIKDGKAYSGWQILRVIELNK
jgi:hypothetical protein